MLRLNVKLSEVHVLRLRATVHAWPLFYLRTEISRVYVRKNYATVKINPKAHHKARPALALKSQIIMTILSSSRADERVEAE